LKVLWERPEETLRNSFKTCREDIVNKHVCGFRSKVGELQLIILTRPPLEHAPTTPAGVGKHVVLNKHVKTVCGCAESMAERRKRERMENCKTRRRTEQN
jgi:hypothetical protein